jgi:hypothetical protein
LRIEKSGIERFNAGDAAFAKQKRLPVLLRGGANGRKEAYASDYNSAGNRRSLLPDFTRVMNAALPGSGTPGGRRVEENAPCGLAAPIIR